jgi:hypothetical protein
MRRNRQRFLWLSIAISGVLTLSSASLGQGPDSKAEGPLTTDWSNHHQIFSRPATSERAKQVQQDPRYGQQLLRRSAKLPDMAAVGVAAGPRDSDASLDFIRNLNGDWSQDMGSGATVGATNYPAKYSFNISIASCASDFVLYGTGLQGALGQASIVAYNNIYSGCVGTVPSVYWAYDTKGTIVTSPVFSRDGTQVAFVQKGGGFKSTMILLKWQASTTESITSPMLLTPVYSGLYPACIAPCDTDLHFTDGSGTTVNPDSNSSIFYDYSSDTAYIGDDGGWLHQYTPFFNGKPAEVRTGGWPVQVNPLSPTPLTSPVHDDVSGNVFVADTGGFLYLVNPTGGVTISGQLDFSSAESGLGIVQGPVVDSTAGLVYVFASSDGSGGCLGGSADCTAVYQLTTSFSAGSTGSEAVVGSSTPSGTAPNPLYLGAFDSTYENSVNATGHLYVCGNTGGPPILYQVTIGNGVLGTVTPGPNLATGLGAPPACSPVTDVFNPNTAGGATEWIFASVENSGVATGCSSAGCIFNFKDTPWLPSTAYTVGQEVLDSNLHVQVVSVAGTSGAASPFWNSVIGGTTIDGTGATKVTWLDQGPISAFPVAAWLMSHHYTKGTEILDRNNNIELVTTAGNSGGTIPSFNMTAGGTTTDGTVKWTNVGAIATANMPATGGTSGMIIDNTVGSGTLAGASQIYFSTLSDQPCGTSGTGGCAVQAAQSTLQ